MALSTVTKIKITPFNAETVFRRQNGDCFTYILAQK